VTHGAYLQAIRDKSDELGIISDDVMDDFDAKELVTVLPTITLEYVINNPNGVGPKHKWHEAWLSICQEEYMQRMLLL